jgi:hypothetical protein
MPLYFAYGSNMDVAAMKARCPRSTPTGLARLPRHRFVLTARGFASIARDAKHEVHGLLWSLALADIPALDRWEEISRGLYAKIDHPVIRKGAAAVRALVYVAREPGPPGPAASRDYCADIARAGRDVGLPLSYIAELERAALTSQARHAPAGG